MTVPIDALHIDSDISRAWSVPAPFYTDAAVFAREFEWYLPKKDLESKSAKDAVNFSHQTQLEDIGICETVQKNLRSRSYERGRYSVKQEKSVHAFHRMYAEVMR
jgi:hypothetical protein